MSDIKEVDALADFKLTLDHFYSIVKEQLGNITAPDYLQLQATAIPFDVSTDYPWFSYGNINALLDIRMDPTPVANNLRILNNARYSTTYIEYLAELLALVEVKELDSETLKRIDSLETKVENNGSRISVLESKRLDDWEHHAHSSMVQPGDLYAFLHWSQGHYTTRAIEDLSNEQGRDQSLIQALRIRRYDDPSQQAVVDAWAAATSPAARMRYPRYEDATYLDEAKKFSPAYFAALADNDSSLFANRQLTKTLVSLANIATGAIGSFSDTVTRQSAASSSITTDWSASGSGGWGPVRFSANVSSHQKIQEDFKHTQSIGVGAKSLQALPIDATAWFEPDVLSHPLAVRNRRRFERFLGKNGTLRFQPTHLIVARGFNLKFTSSQQWEYDYESDFSASGSASASIFGVGWGGGGKYSQSKREQKVERRGHDLILDDGDNLRILGYKVSENTGFQKSVLIGMEEHLAGFI